MRESRNMQHHTCYRRAGRKAAFMKTQRLTLPIENLSCGGGGALQAEQALARVSGVTHVYVNPATEMAYVEYNTERVEYEQMVKAVERLGFRVGIPSFR
jgi:copper chaperone CopZ